MMDQDVKKFLDLLCEKTGVDPTYVLPEMSLAELEVDELSVKRFKDALEGHFSTSLNIQIDDFSLLSCRQIVSRIKEASIQRKMA